METITRLAAWSEFLHSVRGVMRTRGFLEVTTPHLVTAGAFEGVIDPVETRSSRGPAQLHSSPEMEMKQILAQCPLDIFQVCQCFRDDPHSATHRTEFTMLEFYRMDPSLQAVLEDMEALLRDLGHEGEIRKVSLRELFREQMGWDFAEFEEEKKFAARVAASGIHVATDDQWWDLFARVLLEKIEPSLDPNVPTVVYNFPKQMSALAAPSPDPACCDRFEIYWKGMELCNGCVELIQPAELKRRIEVEASIRKSRDKTPHPVPLGLVQATENGLPESSGVAVGLNRLFHCLNPQFSVFEDEGSREH